ncbi:hypothetical protein JG688_00005846 [Phytophthora aleatoria]|uniref:Chorein N-terminal domain-containing protein n=1 Tax=Phytophthora aleatoria TaxID=2496075 RepID=A0A8J5MGV7_9STRA|nr:hypothetical protein JG688_00005846 [Phytophthora aleatoria]
MFEKVVESVLEEYVSEWVEGLDSEKMKVALFAGKVEFRDLRMRGAALDKFQLPMKMKSGSVGKLSIKVPWKKLTSQAVKIKIEDVFLVVEPTDQDEARKNEEDDDSYVLRTRWAKQQEVRMLELLEKVKNDGNSSSASEHDGDPGTADPDPTASWSYRKKILNTIMDNVSFEFTNIHIRYEDSKHLASSIPLALGLTIDSIVISTTNANGQPEFVDRAQARTAFVHRRLEMVQASVYEYIHLHKNMLRAAKKKKLVLESVMTDRNRLNELEDCLEVPTIVFFRLCAAREIELEAQGNDSPRKLSQWKSKWSSGRTSSGSSNGGASNGRDNFLEKMELYLAVNDRMHASSEGRTSSFHEERNVEALLMASDLVVISFEVVLVEEYKVGDKSDTRDFLRFELNEFVVTVLQRTSSSTVSSRITSVQILDFRQTYEVDHLEKKEPQALLSMIDTISPNGQVATRKNPFVELNIESSENKFQLDCVFERFRYIHNLKKQSDECCGSAEMEAIHAKLNALQDQKVSEDAIDEDELQAHYYSEVSAIMVQLEGNTLQSSSAQDISLEVGANTSLRVYNEATKRYHDLVALFKQVGGSRSMEVTFVERYLLLNQTDHVLLASAVSNIAAKKGAGDDKKLLAAPPRSTSEFSGDDKQAEDYQWSGKFSLHDVSETALKVIRVEAAVQVCVVVTSEDVAEFPLYRIINSCARETIWFKQIFDGVKKDASAFQRGVMQSVAPGESVCFGWDEAFFLGTPNREISVWYAPKDGTTSSDYHSSILLDQPGESQQVEIPSKAALPKAPSRVYVRWHLQGMTKTMVAQDVPLNRKERAGKQTRELVAAHGETERSTTPGFTSEVVAHFRLPHFGVSLMTSTPDELLLFSGQDVDIAYANINNDHDQCEVKIGCFQLDNQLSDAIYPVVIAPILKKGSGCAGFRDEASSSSPDKQKSVEVRTAHGTEPSSGDEGENGDKHDTKSGSRAPVIRPHFFHLSILRLSYDDNMDYIKYFSAMMQPARIQIDEAFLLALASFVTDCSATLERNYPPERRRLTSEASKVFSKSSDKRFKANSERRIYIETLQLHPVKIQLSVTILNHYGETEESATGLASLVKLPLAVTKALLSSTFSQIDSATLYLNALHLNHAFASGAFLMSTVQQHYMLQGMRQIYSLIGAADILGNPVGLVTNLGVGVKDFFYEPAAGLVTSPQEFVLGLSRGTTSLFTHSLYGAFNAASKVTGTLSEGIATLSLDRKYLAERRAQGPRKQVATHIGTGLIHGTKQLGKGIFAGVTGVITAPAQGAIHGGLPGFIEGVGKGLIGVAVKPAAGVLDLAATTAAGITATTSALDRRTGLGKAVYRRREPRLLRVTSDQRVRVYTPADALVSRLLLTLPMKYKLQLPNELYDTHIFLPGARILVATSLRLLLLEFASEGTLATLTTAIMSSTSIPPPLVLWSHPLSKLVGAQPEKANDDVATSMLSDLEELGTSGTDRVQAFLTDLVVRHQRATATSYGTE